MFKGGYQLVDFCSVSFQNVDDRRRCDVVPAGLSPVVREFEALSEENNPEGSSFFSKVKGFWDGMKG